MSETYNILDEIVTKLKAVITKANAHDTDYVTSQGETSNWKWRKWKSGKTEAWRTYSGTAADFSPWGNIYYRDIAVGIPNDIFSGSPAVAVTSFSNQHWVVSATSNSATSISVRLGAVGTAHGYQPFLYIYAWEN